MTTARLQDHHLADLRSSGLDEETIRLSGCYSATEPTTRMLLGWGVGPGLVFPFPGCTKVDGTEFCQVKPDNAPQIDGKPAKYVTPKESGCRVYLPPILDRSILTDPSRPLYLTEGCKKPLKATQDGLPTLAFAGVDAWRDRRNGKGSAPIPELDSVAWKTRQVYIIYDSDLARKPPVRFAEFRLARELRERGAKVYAIRIPGGPNGEKVGLDDYLVGHSVDTLCEIEPEPIQHPVREEETRAKAEAPPADEMLREGDDFTHTWAALGIAVHMTRLRDQPEGVQGEISVTVNGRPLHWARLNLASLSARETLVTKLSRTHPGHPWRDLLEQVCRRTTESLRTTVSTVQLQPVRGLVERHLVDKLLLDQETNLVFADGGQGKSLLGMALSVGVVTGKPLPAGLTPRHVGPVLYLDWESCQDEHQERLAGLMTGLGVSGPVPIFYRRMVGALADEMPTVRAEVARLAPVLIIVDSLGPACGAEPEGADAAIRVLNALRSVGPARLVLAHVSKLHADQRGATRPFGSVYVMNLPRNVWEIRRAEQDADAALTLGLYHRKTNRGRLLAPFGLRFEFDEAATKLRSADLTEDEALRERAGLTHSLRATLRSGGQTIAQLAEALEAKEDTVQKAMYRLEKAGVVVRLEDIKPGPGKAIRWGLKA